MLNDQPRTSLRNSIKCLVSIFGSHRTPIGDLTFDKQKLELPYSWNKKSSWLGHIARFEREDSDYDKPAAFSLVKFTKTYYSAKFFLVSIGFPFCSSVKLLIFQQSSLLWMLTFMLFSSFKSWILKQNNKGAFWIWHQRISIKEEWKSSEKVCGQCSLTASTTLCTYSANSLI